jgi:hypothetical protein
MVVGAAGEQHLSTALPMVTTKRVSYQQLERVPDVGRGVDVGDGGAQK